MNTVLTTLLKMLTAGQKGNALPIVLCALAIGGLTIAGGVNYATTSIIGSGIIEKDLEGIYAADAGIEETLWELLHGVEPSTELTDDLNGMTVNVDAGEGEEYTIVFGELIEPGEHSDYVSIGGNITWDDIAGAYKYVISVSSQHTSTIHISEVGARIPPGYTYQAGSAAIFPDNLSLEEPDVTVDSVGASLLNWELGAPLPYVDPSNPVETQSFYISGNGSIEGAYTWVVSNRSDIGEVGEISGTKYVIFSEAAGADDGITTARLRVSVIISGGAAYILSWQIIN